MATFSNTNGILKVKSVRFNQTSKLNRKLADAIERKFETQRNRIIKAIQEKTRAIVEKYIREHPVFQNLTNGAGKGPGLDLEAEFGLHSGEGSEKGEYLLSLLLELVKVPQRGVKIHKGSTLRSVRGTFTVNILDKREYFRLALDKAFWYTSPQFTRRQKKALKKKGGRIVTFYRINWLRWIFEANEGIRTIKKDNNGAISRFGISYEFRNNAERAASRSGRAIMRSIAGAAAGGELVQQEIIRESTRDVKDELASLEFLEQHGALDEDEKIRLATLRKRQSAKSFDIKEVKKFEKEAKGLQAERKEKREATSGRYRYPVGAKPTAGYENFIEEIKDNRKMIGELKEEMGIVLKDIGRKR